MRRVLFVTLLAGACARPVLYYPTPESAGIKPSRPEPSAAVAPAATTAAVPVPADPNASTATSDADYLKLRHILMPVAGADISRVDDTFNDGRDGGERTHHAIDILAPRGTPILSADDGRILRMSNSTLGGITMYTVDSDARLVYYYAHMDRYNDAMSPGRTIMKGDTLGYVGTTGNAPKDTPHLHFQVMRWPADGKYWNGEPIDPFEALGGLTRAERARRASSHPDEP
jgi:murein DD-endopeptidase MepM/ murein hydrolase activator NlpD